MEYLSIIWEYLIPFIVVLTVLVFVHEMGHYTIARRCGVRIEVFSIGFGPELFGWTDAKETRWKISAIPLGGYVKMFGEGEFRDENGAPRTLTMGERAVSFRHKSLGQRAAIVVAGPAANFLFAIAVFAGLFAIHGQPYTPAEISAVVEGSAAAEAGMQPGDLIIRIDGRVIERFEDVRQVVAMNPQRAMEITVRRDGAEVLLFATPKTTEIDDGSGRMVEIGLLGVRGSMRVVRQLDPLSAGWEALQETWNMSVGTLRFLGEMILQERSTDGLGGPIKIAQMSGAIWKIGIAPIFLLMAQLSISLGLINLFPIPLLDGGHLLFYGVEAIRGRPLGEKTQEFGFRIGLVLVLSLMLFVIINDIVNLPIWNT
jgi:regulator of sigma E protease